MDINKLKNNIDSHLTGTKGTDNSHKTSPSSTRKAKSDDSVKDKVSLENYSVNKSEKEFAKVELKKLNQTSFDRLKNYKAKLSEYNQAGNISTEAAKKTEIGKLINDPDTWNEIARQIIEE